MGTIYDFQGKKILPISNTVRIIFSTPKGSPSAPQKQTRQVVTTGCRGASVEPAPRLPSVAQYPPIRYRTLGTVN